jgi:hypothetical protein
VGIAAAALALAILLAACAGPTSSASVASSPTPVDAPVPASPTATPTTGVSPSPSPSTHSQGASPLPTPSPTAPTAEAFWALAAEALADARTLDVLVEQGDEAAHLRYEPSASATVAGGDLVFVCIGGRAYEGASAGFSELPGRWSCGGPALVAGFRRNGQPIDAWNETIASDDRIRESATLAADGSWLWAYEATSDAYGGRVETVVTLGPASGRIGTATRTDPLGTTTYTFTYGAAFPPVEAP